MLAGVAPAGVNGDSPAPKTSRRGRRKSDVSPSTAPPKRRMRRPEKNEIKDDEEKEEFDDGIDVPYMSLPLVCCFGEGWREFLPTLRVSDRQMDAEMYSSWNGLQWDPPEFVRAPGGLPSNEAISHAGSAAGRRSWGRSATTTWGMIWCC